MAKYYILNGKTPIPAASCTEAAISYKNRNEIVKQEQVGASFVSTVFTMIDHRFSGDGPPLLFETQVFDGPMDGEMERYSTWEEAEAGHKAMVERVKKHGE